MLQQMVVCVCERVSEREMKGERQNGREREREREGDEGREKDRMGETHTERSLDDRVTETLSRKPDTRQKKKRRKILQKKSKTRTGEGKK